MKGNITMSAIEEFKQHITEVATLGEQVNQINARIRQIQGIANEAQAPAQQAAVLKAKRRSILARLFLGTGDNSELPGTEKAIAEAEAAAHAEAPTREGAEAAIEELRRQEIAIAQQIHATYGAYQPLYHAALMEHAKDALPAYHEAVAKLREAYTELIGRCRAVDELADRLVDREPIGSPARRKAAYGFPDSIEVPPAPTFGAGNFITFIDARSDVEQAKESAKRHIDAIAMQAANITNQVGATK